jgi:ATPase subunit of ABC transporter with duplicated ATPase domains
VERLLTEQLRCAFILVSHDRELLDSSTDPQRKLKHQKPALQAAWQAEITQLYARLA